MKKLIIICFLLAAYTCEAQKDTEKVEQYCELVATPRLLSAKVTIDIDYGEERSIWKDNRMKDESGRVKKFNTTIDALNFLGKNGWKLVNAFPVTSGNSPSVYHYVFKREMSKAEAE